LRTAAERNAELRQLLEDVSAHRTSVDAALRQINAMQRPSRQSAASSLQPTVRTSYKRNSASWFGGIIMAFIGSIFFGVGILTSWPSIQLLDGSARAEGVVVRMIGGGKGSKPVVRFFAGGKPFEIEGKISSSPPAFRTGERVEVIYRIADPELAIINSFVERWLFPVIFGGIGLVLSLVGLGMLATRILGKLRSAFTLDTDPAERFSIE